MRPAPSRPKREPLWSAVRRNGDGALIEVWATKHTWRSQDRELDGTTYYRPLVFIGGALFDHMPRRCVSPQATVDYVQGFFAK